MTNELDCRGMECPAPVLQVRNLVEKESCTSISVLVDNEAARQNVSRLLEHHSYKISSAEQGVDFLIHATRGDGAAEFQKTAPVTAAHPPAGMKKIMVLITGTHMGSGDDSLGDMLMFNFIKTLKEMGHGLWRVVFVNSGVSFTAEGSEGVPILQELASQGVRISACGACLAYFHLLDKIQVGEVTNMLEIVTGMKEADSVITL